jgi:thioredoxin-dependent peroxiredoxin
LKRLFVRQADPFSWAFELRYALFAIPSALCDFATEKEVFMQERAGIITMKGNPLTLIGNEVKVGDKAPEFVALDNTLSPVRLSSFKGKICVLASVPSLDTPVCDLETRKFNEEASHLGADTIFLTISMDLPFAQRRWCGAAGVTRVQTLSDHRDASFGTSYGVLIKELRLLARAVFVVDQEGMIRHAQLVKEVTQEPDYNAVLSVMKKLLCYEC